MNYYGTAEIAAACKVSRQAVANWVKRGKMPPPNVRLRMGPVWYGPEIEEFIEVKRNYG